MDQNGMAIYHRVMRRENFETAANDLIKLLYKTQKDYPNQKRTLYVDIDGHRDSKGTFDDDMFELQTEFGAKFLLQFFSEVNFPLISVKNAREQVNDVPEKLIIGNAEYKRDMSLEKLYIENYSNTEFVSEEDVYTYLKKVSGFLKKYNDTEVYDSASTMEQFEGHLLLRLWNTYLKNIICELFNAFVYGNLLCASAMTRTLIEAYGYLSVLMKEKSVDLLEEWFLCCLISKSKKWDGDTGGEIKKLAEAYGSMKNRDFQKVYNELLKKNENGWLASVIPEKRITFRMVCDYVGDEYLYEDFQNACSFIHAQDIASKLMPFTFYDSIYPKLYLMLSYSFKAIRLFPVNEEMEEAMLELQEDLVLLMKNYMEK